MSSGTVTTRSSARLVIGTRSVLRAVASVVGRMVGSFMVRSLDSGVRRTHRSELAHDLEVGRREIRFIGMGWWDIEVRGEAEQTEEQVGSSSKRQVRVDQRENQETPQRGARGYRGDSNVVGTCARDLTG